MSKNRVAQVRIALLGYQRGDRVIVKKVLGGNWPELRDKSGVIVSWKRATHNKDWFLIRLDEPPHTNGPDMEPE